MQVDILVCPSTPVLIYFPATYGYIIHHIIEIGLVGVDNKSTVYDDQDGNQRGGTRQITGCRT